MIKGSNHRVDDLTGRRFGSFVVHSFAGYRHRFCAWNCIRPCGCMTVMLSSTLRRYKLHPDEQTQCKICHPPSALWVKYEGQTMSLAEACRRGGYRYSTVRLRISAGESFQKACQWLDRHRWYRYYTVDGITRTRKEWAALNGLHSEAIRARIVRLGWSERDAGTTPRQKGGKGGIRWTKGRATKSGQSAGVT